MRKVIIKCLQSLIVLATLLFVAVFVGPIVYYYQTQPLDLKVAVLDGKQHASSYDWLAAHYKWSSFSTAAADLNQKENKAAPDLIWIDDSSSLNVDLGTQLSNNVIVGEYLLANEYATPIQKDQVTFLFDVQDSGFIGKSVADLSDPAQVPKPIKDQYELLYHKKWDFYGKGLILFSNRQMLVLLSGTDYQGDFLWKSDEIQQVYYGYFEIVSTHEKVTSQFQIEATAQGENKLAAIHLTTAFPASIESQKRLYASYYFTSPLKNTAIHMPSYFYGAEKFQKKKGLYDRLSSEQIYWQWYIPKIEAVVENILTKKAELKTLQANAPSNSKVVLSNPRFKIEGQEVLKLTASDNYEPFFMKGVNLGTAVPGKAFTEFPQDLNTYRQWLNQMKSLNINTLRVYTLLPPTFYKALYDYNLDNPEHLIYLLQEIWPEENPKDHNYLLPEYNATYQKEIEYGVHAIHGNISIPKRSYRAYGAYAYDVSPYLIGYLVGRELEPDEVIATNNLNPDYQFKGQYLYSEENASPTEGWLAASCDYALEVERKAYGSMALVSIVNWPTLDPLVHESETALTPEGTIDTKAPAKGALGLTYNDKAVVNINHIGIHENKMPGLFGSYHIYPNYPDFMNNDPEYSLYKDELGRFRYGGYLKAFMEQHTKYPALVAEYGISTSMYTAHIAPDGNHHGGLSEEAQGKEIIRMSRAIEREGYAGGLIFEWIDEWTKKTWTTEPYMIPYNRHMLWHNAMDPEQNYGLIDYEGLPNPLVTYYENASADLRRIQASTDTTYLNLVLTYATQEAAGKATSLSIDTHQGKAGDHIPEFLLKLGPTPELQVNPGYNWTKGKFRALPMALDQYESMDMTTNGENLLKNGTRTGPLQISLGKLSTGSFAVDQNHISINGNVITIRLPYGLLGISDPSSLQVLSDLEVYNMPPLADTIRTVKSDQLHFSVTYGQQEVATFDHPMVPWDEVTYTSRPKASFNALSDFFKTFGNESQKE